MSLFCWASLALTVFVSFLLFDGVSYFSFFCDHILRAHFIPYSFFVVLKWKVKWDSNPKFFLYLHGFACTKWKLLEMHSISLLLLSWARLLGDADFEFGIRCLVFALTWLG